jgi:hypothetical protein
VSREARLAVDAAHPNVVEVLDAGADDTGAPYVVLERLYGEPLETLLDRPLSLRSTCEAIVPVCNALEALHRSQILHRDLKPSNIFLNLDSGRLTPKLLDFGIAKALEGAGETLAGSALGTPAYMAPEQVFCCGASSPASDVWSLAVVCVRCLTGRLPFASLGQRGRFRLDDSTCPPELEAVPQPLARVLAAALRFDPARRPAHAGEFRTELLAALRELDPEQSWPDASSISFSEEHCALARDLRERSSAARNGTTQGALGRAQDVLTRTLSLAWQSAATPRIRWAGRAALALLGAAALTLLAEQRAIRAYVALHYDSLRPVREELRREPEARPADAERLPAVHAPEWLGPASDGIAVDRVPADGSAADGSAKGPQPVLHRVEAERRARDARRARSVSAASAPKLATDISQPGSQPASTIVVGANRSPIIE